MEELRRLKKELLALKERKLKQLEQTRIHQFYPASGPLCRDNYPRHMEYFASPATERLLLAANRVGKTEGVGCYEVALHLTGDYPDWWVGHRFERPIQAWVAGTKNQTTRDILQHVLLGPITNMGTGLIPAKALGRYTRKAGIADAVDTIAVAHKAGGESTLGFKAFEQGQQSFMGTAKDVILLDEEPPLNVYTEALIRTMTTNGLMLLTFTPLLGMSLVVREFLNDGKIPDGSVRVGAKQVIMATWDDAPHLSDAQKEKLMASIPVYQRDARTKGIPQLGAGAIYPIPESEVVIDNIPIPEHWPRVYALDVGWKMTAVLWAAMDRDTDTMYLYDEYYRGQKEPGVHGAAIRLRGDWIPGVIDPAAHGRAQRDGAVLMDNYKQLGLDLQNANNAREGGIWEVYQRMTTGRLKVFKSCTNWLSEFRMYRRDERGNVVKEMDHLMDDTRYLCLSGLQRAKTKPKARECIEPRHYHNDGLGWLGV